MDTTSSALIRLNRDWLKVTGPDATRFLQGMWTSDFKKASDAAKKGQLASGEGYLLTAKGKPVAPAVFLALAENEFLLSIPGGFGGAVQAALEHYLVADEVEISSPGEWSAVARPFGSVEAAAKRLPVAVPGAADELFYVDKSGDDFVLPRALLSSRHEEIWRLGSAVSFSGAMLSREDALELRIEAGLPEWSVDLGPEDLILEFPHARQISFHKGCYIGQEVVARATHRGKINRAFSRFEAEAPLEPGLLYAESDPERAIGKLTTVLGPRALGLVRLAALAPREDGTPAGRLFQKGAHGAVLIRSVTPLV